VIYLAAREIQARGRRRIHRTIDGSLLGLLTDQPNPALASIRELAVSHGVLARRGDVWHVDQAALNATHGFHDIRLKNPVGVIANELEPVRDAVRSVRELVNLSHHQLRDRVADLLHGEDAIEFETDYQTGLASLRPGDPPARSAPHSSCAGTTRTSAWCSATATSPRRPRCAASPTTCTRSDSRSTACV
jgi:hypothetical protein